MNTTPNDQPKRRGRPPKQQAETPVETQGQAPSRGRPTSPERKRRRRSPDIELSSKRLGVPMSWLNLEEFRYRFINDEPGRLYAMTQEDDWEFAPSGEQKMDEQSVTQGDAVSRVVGVHPDGKPMLAYFCRKRRDWYDEDQREKRKTLDEHEQQLQRGASRAGDAQSDYIPNDGISMSGGRTQR